MILLDTPKLKRLSMRIALLLLLCTSFICQAQTNTFPASGYVGIGTTTPSANLDIHGTAGSVQLLVQPSSTGHGIAKIASNGDGHAHLDIDANYASYIDFLSAGISKWQIGRPSGTYDFQIYNSNLGNVPFLIQSATGNVGIGTSSPSFPLHVYKGTSAINDPQITVSGYNNMNLYLGAYADANTGSSLKYSFLQASEYGVTNDRSLALNPFAGNVGIGVTNPSSKLYIGTNSLGSSNGDRVNILSSETNVGRNTSILNLYSFRSATGSDWLSATTRLQQRIDGTDMGFIDFNPPGMPWGVALWYEQRRESVYRE